LLDPQAFGGLEGATRQIDFVAAACHASTPRTPAQPVRLPGERGLARRAEQLAGGVVLHPSIAPLLAPWQEKFGIAAPTALA
jgi:L-lactate dehydrogenase